MPKLDPLQPLFQRSKCVCVILAAQCRRRFVIASIIMPNDKIASISLPIHYQLLELSATVRHCSFCSRSLARPAGSCVKLWLLASTLDEGGWQLRHTPKMHFSAAASSRFASARSRVCGCAEGAKRGAPDLR